MDPGRSLSIFSRVPYLKPLILIDSDIVLLLHMMKEREGEDREGGDGSLRDDLVTKHQFL